MVPYIFQFEKDFRHSDIHIFTCTNFEIRKIMIMMNGRGIDGDGNENDEA